MRISDWSSDVCSSDLHPAGVRADEGGATRLSCRNRYRTDAPAVWRINIEAAAAPAGIPQQTVGIRHRAVRTALARGNGGEDLSRSEEHTSELQSLMRISYAVFCLKKKKLNTYT